MKMVSFLSVLVIFVALVLPLKTQDTIQDYLNAHNQARAAVGVGPMVWDETVATYARNYTIQGAGDCNRGHFDQNIGKVCGHYTQVVWRNLVRLECAKVKCSNGGTFIICSYAPPGNYIGQRPY